MRRIDSSLPLLDTPFSLARESRAVIDDFDAVLPPADADAEDDDRSRNQPPGDPEEGAEWRSEFRSFLDDPA